MVDFGKELERKRKRIEADYIYQAMWWTVQEIARREAHGERIQKRDDVEDLFTEFLKDANPETR